MLRTLAILVLLLPLPALAAEGVDWQRGLTIEYWVQADGQYRSEQYFDIVPQTPEAARQAAQQSYGWSSGLEDASLVEAVTAKPDGAVLKVAADAVLNQPLAAGVDDPSFSDWQVRSIVFPDVRPGDHVRYVLHRQSRQTLFPGVFEAAMRLGGTARLSATRIVLHVPAVLPLHIATHHLRELPVHHDADGQVTREWALDASGVDAQPVSWIVSSFADYAALGNAFAARALPQAQPEAAIRDLAAKLTDGIADKRERVHALYDFVAGQIRYVGLQMGRGRIVPRAASAVLASGYGDCKDHVALLQALLASIGVAANPALISTKPRYELAEPATLDSLDHVILHVPSLDMWMDATSGYAPFGVLPIGEYGKPVVVAVAGGKSHVATVPALPPGLAWSRVETELDMADDGSLSGTTETSAGGPYAISLREIADGLTEVRDQLQRLGTPGSGSYSFDPPMALRSDDYSIGAHFALDDGLADTADQALLLPAGPTVMVRPGGFLVSETTSTGAHVCYAGRQEEEIRLHLPAALAAPSLPRNVDVKGGFARYSADWRQEGGDVVLHRSFTVDAPHPVCSAEEYQQMKPVLRAARLDLQTRLALHDAPNAVPTAMLAQPSLRAVNAMALLPDAK